MSDLLAILAERGLDEAEYLQLMRDAAGVDTGGLTPEEAERVEFTRLNLHRTERIARHWKPSEELAALMERRTGPETWLVLTEPWCGDSAQCLPCIAALAASRPDIRLRLVLRDANPAVMERFLTGGKQAIPILAILDEQGAEKLRWGPRPAAAQALFDAAKGEGLEKPQILERLHLFYGRDRGRALDAEFVALLGSDA